MKRGNLNVMLHVAATETRPRLRLRLRLRLRCNLSLPVFIDRYLDSVSLVALSATLLLLRLRFIGSVQVTYVVWSDLVLQARGDRYQKES